MKGKFVVSLDFEGMWGSIGGLDNVAIDAFEKRVGQNTVIIPKLLTLFEKYGIHATWAVVGCMLCNSKEEILEMLTRDIYYPKWNLSIKEYIQRINNNSLYFFPELIMKVANSANQEIGSHTFSHYYGDEDGATKELFGNELNLAKRIAIENGLPEPVSLVMPRNQVVKNDNDVVHDCGFKVIRGRAFNYFPTGIRKVDKILNFLDSYIPLFHRSFKLSEIEESDVINIRASALFRTYFAKLRFLEPLRLWRIKLAMKKAAQKGEVYHLWFHPHNMATNIDYNFNTLEKIFVYYTKLQKKYEFESFTMLEAANSI